MARLLFHILTGPQDPTRLALGLLVAKTAAQAGHEVDVFLAGDAVHILDAGKRDGVNGLGTGSASEHWAALVESGAGLYGSRMSAKARDIGEPDGVRLATPDQLVELITTADRVVTY